MKKTFPTTSTDSKNDENTNNTVVIGAIAEEATSGRNKAVDFSFFAMPSNPLPLPSPAPTTPSPSPSNNELREMPHLQMPYVENNDASSPTPSERSALGATDPTTLQGGRQQRRLKSGILRLDMHKPRRRSSGGGDGGGGGGGGGGGSSVEFRSQPQMLGEDVTPPTGTTSPHQLSVTWATNCDLIEEGVKFKPMLSNSEEGTLSPATERERRPTFLDDKFYELSAGLESPVHGDLYYQPHHRPSDADNYNYNDEDEDDDYSISVSAIMQRRASVRGFRNKRGSRSSRRTSSPMDHVLDNAERRRSSVYTTSSDEGTNQESTQEQIFENIRLHKEVIQSVKLQPWHIRKKLKLVRQAKTYVARHEGALQERFAMSRSTRDLWARFKIVMAARWRHWKRETASFLTVLIPWELRIKEIESHFGSGVASYFTFLRWLMWVNIMIAIPLVAFVIGPEYFATKNDETDPRKKMTEHEFNVAGNLFTIWEFEGYLKYSPMFYGYYSSLSGASSLGYKLPLAYFLTAVVVYIYSFVATLRKMAENSRNSKLSSKDDECTFSWKLFTGWDFMIGHAETAHNRIASVVVGFKEALLEEAEKKKDNRNWRIILQRILVNILVMGLLAASGYTVVVLVNNSENLALQDNWLSRNAVNVTMTLLSFFLPMIFEALGLFENWHPRQQLRLQLARIMILNMLNLYSLMFSFIYKINSKEKPLQKLKISNDTATLEYAQLTAIIESIKSATTTTLSYQDTTPMDDMISTTRSSSDTSTTDFLLGTTASAIYSTVSRLKCYNITIRCSKPTRIGQRSLATTTTALLLLNLTTTMLPASTTIESSTTNEPVMTTMWTTGDLSSTETTTTTATNPSTLNNILTTYSDTTTPPPTTTTTDLTTTTTTASSTTIEDFKTQNFEDDEATYSSPDVSSTTTTPAPGNDSFFDYYDYFVGLPIDIDSSEDLTGDMENDDDGSRSNKDNAAQVRRIRAAQAAADEVSSNVNGSGESVQKPPRKSKYSRRKPDGNQLQPLTGNNDNEEDVTSGETSTTTATGSTRMTTLLTTNPTIRPITTTTRTATTKLPATSLPTTTTSPTTTSITPITSMLSTSPEDSSDVTTLAYTSSPSDSTARNESILWQRNEILQNVLAYFTTTTTTNEPPPTTTMSKDSKILPLTTSTSTSTSTTTTSTTTTTTTSKPLTTIKSDTLDERTPYFINDDEIADIGETMFFDANELDDDSMENCTRMICEPADMFTSTTEMDSTTMFNTEVPMPQLTPLELHQRRLAEVKQTLKTVQRNLTSMCWETSLGQELSKVIVFDGIMSIVAPLCIDFLRALFVRYVNQNWCWDMEKTFPQYGDFKIAENILTLINNQGQVWMGIFFSPGLVIINLVKLMIMMYFRSWIVLTCNVPHEVVFKASKSNNFYLSLLLTMLFLCVLPVGYAIVWLRPSWHCGPFSDYNRISEFITNTTRNALPKQLHEPLDYMTSSSTVIPLLLLLILIIYYLVSLTGALREANQDLRTQLQKEREEERKKIFKVPEVKQAEPSATTLTNRWRKVLEASSPVTPTQAPDFETDEYKNQARKELISRIMKKALRKGSATSEDESVVVRQGRDDDDTDTEHHDSLPHDEDAKDKRFGLSKLQQIRRTRKPSLVDIVHIAKTERERAAAAAAAATVMPAAKEIHPKGRFKIERHEKKDDGAHKTTPATSPAISPATSPVTATDHDPDVNSRIVNERRASLLYRKRDEAVNEEQKPQAVDENLEEAKTPLSEGKSEIIGKKPTTEDSSVVSKKPSTDDKVAAKRPTAQDKSGASKKPTTEENSTVTKKQTGQEKSAISKKTGTDEKSAMAKKLASEEKSATMKKSTSGDKSAIAKKSTNGEKSAIAKKSATGDKSPMAKKPVAEQKSPVAKKATTDEKPLPTKKPPKHSDSRHSLRKVLPFTHSDSNVTVVNEKKPSSPPPPPPPNDHSTEFKFKLRRPRLKESKPSSSSSASAEPEVFKFDEKAVERSQSKQLARPIDTATASPSKPTPNSQIDSPSPKNRGDISPTTPTSLKNQNAEKLANLSRQGRKKIGSLLALVREAVKKSDSDSPPTTGEESDSNAVTIQMSPPTPEPQKDKIAPLDMKLATAGVKQPTEQPPPPPTPKLAAVEDFEDLDQPGPITFPPRNTSQRPNANERSTPKRQDSQISVWSDNIPTITISHTGSEERINVEPEPQSAPTTPGSVVNIIKIQIEDDNPAKT